MRSYRGRYGDRISHNNIPLPLYPDIQLPTKPKHEILQNQQHKYNIIK